MSDSIMDGKTILAVDDEPDVLTTLQEEIMVACPNSIFDRATTYEDARSLLKSKSYDLVILDIMGVRGFDLLDLAVKRGFKVAMLTAHSLSADSLKRAINMGARSYLPKEKLGELIPFLEDVLKYDHKSGWKRLVEVLDDFFTERFEPGWKKRIGFP